MQDQRTAHTPFDEQDPAGNRLTREQVIEINKAQLDGIAWDTIALQNGTTRRNVARIVQGRRWRDIHPNVAPHLYVDTPEPLPSIDPMVAIVNDALREARDRILSELRELPTDRSSGR